MKAAFLGSVGSGKSTLLATISGKELSHTGGTVQVEEIIATVPDERLDWLFEHYKSKKKTIATIDCLDLPGLSFADDHSRAAARRLLNQIRTAELLVLVIRAFDNAGIKAAPLKEVSDLMTELLLTDLELVETRIEKLEQQLKKPTKDQAKQKAELEIQLKLRQTIESNQPLSTAIKTEEELGIIKSLGFLTLKPITVVFNTPEDNPAQVFDTSSVLDTSVPVISVCIELEYEISQLDQDSRADFMKDLGITEPMATKFIHSCYKAMGLITFLTVGENEARSWPIKAGTSAVEAAGKIHSDIARGFIRAETMSFSELKEASDEKALKAAGKVRLEGKNYIIQDGDIILFRFNV
ncbi:MAG: redox-regulated ATPase YchF [Sedimentisphaerales bacterium]|nr:redox-regulated ATPase YchF [Sedimentisphaerales bacterium]